MKSPAWMQRILAAAAGLLRLQPNRVFVPMRQAGVVVNEDTALTLSEWWACVNVIARTMAALPWHVYERTTQGRRPLDSSVAWLLNNQPNPETTAFSFRETMLGHVLNWGNAYAEIQRDLAGRPSALWIITPDRVVPERLNGRLQYRIFYEDGGSTVLEPTSIFHLHGLGFDGLTGYSPVRLAARSIGLGLAQDSFAASFYANGAHVGTVVESASGMNATQISDMEKYLNEQHAGPANAFRTKVAPSGIKVHSMTMPLNDAQFIESRGFTVTMAARWLGVPPHKIADLTRSTNNNIEHQSIEFVTDAIVPWATRLEQEANVKLVGARAQGRVYTKLQVNALMRGDSRARAEYYRAMLQLGVMSINEVRELEELNSIGPAGDAHLVQLNQTTLDYLVSNPGAKAATQPSPAPAPLEGDGAGERESAPDSPSNVIRESALRWAREQRRSA